MSCPELSSSPAKSKHFEKGDIHWFDITGDIDTSISTDKIRPYIIINRFNPKSSRVIISPISDIKNYLEKDARGNSKLKYPYHAPLYKKDYPFLEKDSVVLLDQVYTVSKDEFYDEWYIGKVSDTKAIDEALAYNYDLFELMSGTVHEIIKTLQGMKSFESVHTENFTRK